MASNLATLGPGGPIGGGTDYHVTVLIHLMPQNTLPKLSFAFVSAVDLFLYRCTLAAVDLNNQVNLNYFIFIISHELFTNAPSFLIFKHPIFYLNSNKHLEYN